MIGRNLKRKHLFCEKKENNTMIGRNFKRKQMFRSIKCLTNSVIFLIVKNQLKGLVKVQYCKICLSNIWTVISTEMPESTKVEQL